MTGARLHTAFVMALLKVADLDRGVMTLDLASFTSLPP